MARPLLPVTPRPHASWFTSLHRSCDHNFFELTVSILIVGCCNVRREAPINTARLTFIDYLFYVTYSLPCDNCFNALKNIAMSLTGYALCSILCKNRCPISPLIYIFEPNATRRLDRPACCRLFNNKLTYTQSNLFKSGSD